MINLPILEIRQHYEATLGKTLQHIPQSEWEYFKSMNGPFQDSDWKKMPNLYRALGGK